MNSFQGCPTDEVAIEFQDMGVAQIVGGDVGQGVLAAGASAELVQFAELLNIPVMTTPNGKSGFPENHPLALGTAGRARPSTVDHFLEKADVVLALGTSLTRSYYILPLGEDKVILQVTRVRC